MTLSDRIRLDKLEQRVEALEKAAAAKQEPKRGPGRPKNSEKAAE